MSVSQPLVAAFLLVPPVAFAAGGHHAVDDAALLDPGQCQIETWADAFRGGRGSWHLGPACRVGPWELGLNIDRIGLPGEPVGRTLSPQGKWVASIAPGLSAGVVLTATWDQGRYASFQPLVPVTWQASEQVAVHVNVGRDIPRKGPGRDVGGIAAEWSPSGTWNVVAERFNDAFGRAMRIGARWQPNPLFSIDLSWAHALADARGNWVTVGASYFVERK